MVEAALIPAMHTPADERTDTECKQAAGAVDPIVIAGDDDA